MSDEVKKPCTVEIQERFRAPLLAGATHVGVEIRECDTHAVGNVICVGTEEECEAQHFTRLVIVPTGFTASYIIFPASDFLPLIQNERAVAP